MSNEHALDTSADPANDLHGQFHDEELDSIGDHHRMAAHHFTLAAEQHLAAASADDEGDAEANARHAYLAYRHQLNAVQYAEIAALDNDDLDDALEA